MDLSVIIVNYKSRAKLERLLVSLRVADWSGISHEIIVVDNASGDDLSGLETDIKIINSSRNLGMGGGNNLGIDNSQGGYILILNPDTVVKPEAIKVMLETLKNNQTIGLVGPKLVYPDGSLQYSCSEFPNFWIPILRRTFLGDYFKSVRDAFMMTDFDHDSVKAVGWLMGSCLMFKRGLKFDDRYFMYFEDTDLARQVWQRNLEVIYQSAALVIHDHERASAKHPWYRAIFTNRLAWYHIISWLKYFQKWGFKKAKKGIL